MRSPRPTHFRRTTQVHFHGRAVLAFNNQIPVKNSIVNIYRNYDTGQDQTERVAETVTNNDGFYEVIADVRQKGDFTGYQADFFPGAGDGISAAGVGSVYNNSTDVQINAQLDNYKAYKFHIKNVSPYNSADVLNSFSVARLNFYNYPVAELTHISNLTGNVDTVIYKFYNDSKMNYAYSYTKNSIQTSFPGDTLATPGGLDTMLVNVFY